MSLRKIIILCAFVLAMLCSAAYAAGLGWIDEDRVELNLPEGMKASSSFSNGHLEIEIDNNATDWGMALCSIYEPETGFAFYSPFMHAPEGATHVVGFGCSADSMTDEEILHALSYEWPNENDVFRNGCEVGFYSESNGLFQPMEVTNMMYAFQWQTRSGEIIASEKMRITITFTNTNPVRVELSQFPKSQLIPGYDLSEEDAELADITVENGSVRYKMKQVEREIQLNTFAVCPDAQAAEDSGWKCITAMYGDVMECESRLIDYNGEQILVAEVAGRYLDCSEEQSETFAMTIQWINPEGECVQAGLLKVVYTVGEDKVWPAYVEDWEAVSSGQIAQIEAINAVEGLSATYEGGILTMGVEDDKIPTGSALGSVQFSVKVTPPAGAVYYRENRSGGNDIFGQDFHAVEEQERIVLESELRSVASDPFTLDIYPCNAYESKDLNLTVYLTGDISSEFGGSVNLVYWYDRNQEIISRQWIVERYEPIERVEETPAYEDESDIEGVLKLPAIVVYEDGAREKYTLVITIYPQDGEDSIYYELRLEDRGGNTMELPGKCRLYIPYPEGHHHYSHKKYKIRHYDEKHNEKEVFEDGIIRTEHGLCIEVSSLSPFIISWEDMEIASVLLPADLTEIGEQAFRGALLEGVVIPEGCVSIGSDAFGDMPGLLEASIPESVTAIDPTAFNGSENVVLLVVEGSFAHEFAESYGLEYTTR